MSNGKKRFVMVQHYLLNEKLRKETKEHGTILQIRKRRARTNDK